MSLFPPITSLQAFEAVARRHSFALAAAELHLTPSAVSHQISRLEAFLGVRLFDRSAHGVHISLAGQLYLSRVGGALAAVAAATEDLREGVSNSLYVHSAPSIASLWLMSRLQGFADAYPEIALNLSAAHTPSDFELGRTDIDIRYGIPNWQNLVIEPLFEEKILPLASPAFIEAHGLERPEHLLRVKLIQSNVSVVQWTDWFQKFTKLRAPERFAVRFDRAQMSLDAATLGLGVALESATIAGGHLAEGKLRPVFGFDKAIKVKAHFMVYPARHGKRRAVEQFLAWIHGEAVKGPRVSKARK